LIAVDTNILVRLATRDDPQQAAQAQALLEDSFREEETCFISDPVLCELEWVLDRCYTASRADILTTLQGLFSRPHFEFEDRARLRRVLSAYESGKGDLADYLIGAKAQAHGARSTYTFDRALRNQEGFTVL
jgi:predicted nucleic-acid-binding protein